MNTPWGGIAECKGARTARAGVRGVAPVLTAQKAHRDIRLIKPVLKRRDLSRRAPRIIPRKRAGNETHKNAAAQRWLLNKAAKFVQEQNIKPKNREKSAISPGFVMAVTTCAPRCGNILPVLQKRRLAGYFYPSRAAEIWLYLFI
ncbi:hypothetical protein [Massilia violaceinigra]|uniref:hypothetical protein n=1 Tax=Massilia violaceinigra TaxID=2045208 RepID=UPI0012FD78D1|nr:hypothetical protein [Massilia violaceinigra]